MAANLTFESLKELAATGEIDTVLVCMVDMQGRLMGKRFHVSNFLESSWKETHCCNYLLATDLEMETPEGYASTSWSKGYGDYALRPDLSTLRRIPWLDCTALVLCDVCDHHTGEPIPHSPRQVLKTQIERAEAMGFTPMMATELEFFLFEKSYDQIRRGGFRKLKPFSGYNEDYHILQTTKEEHVMRPIRNLLVAAGVPVENTKGEAEAGQAELNIRYADALLAADNHTIAKQAVKEIMKADAERRRRELDAADEKTLSRTKLAGEKMREAWDRGAGGGRGFVNPSAAPSVLKSPTTKDNKKGAKFDAEAYLAGLEKTTLEGVALVDSIEREGLRKNAELLKEGKITRQQAAEAVTLIETTAAQERRDINLKAAEEQRKYIEDKGKEEVAELKKLNAEKKKAAEDAMNYVANLTRAVNPIDALRQEYEAKLQLVKQYEELMALEGINATAQSAAARAQIESQYQIQRQALAEQTFRSQSDANAFLIDSLNALSSTASTAIMGLLQGTMSAQDAMRGLANTILSEAVSALVRVGLQQIKNALLGDTLAAADSAKKSAMGAVYASSVGAQVAGMSALAAQNAFAATAAIPVVGPGRAPAAAAAAGAAAAALGAPAVATAPLAGAREYGGPVNADSLYRVNEGGRPEMYTASNGAQYMMPTADGRVTSAKGGGQGGMNFTYAPVNQIDGTADRAQSLALMNQMTQESQRQFMELLIAKGVI